MTSLKSKISLHCDYSYFPTRQQQSITYSRAGKHAMRCYNNITFFVYSVIKKNVEETLQPNSLCSVYFQPRLRYAESLHCIVNSSYTCNIIFIHTVVLQ